MNSDTPPYNPAWLGTGHLVRLKDIVDHRRRDPPPAPLTVPWPLDILRAEGQTV